MMAIKLNTSNGRINKHLGIRLLYSG